MSSENEGGSSVDNEKDKGRKSAGSAGLSPEGSEDFYQKLKPEMRRPKPSQDAMAAALEVVQRLAAQADVEHSAGELAEESVSGSATRLCRVCGYQNREGNKFCGMCGLPVEAAQQPKVERLSSEERNPAAAIPQVNVAERQPVSHHGAATGEAHHYHHHYHHHYFPAGQESGSGRFSAELPREAEKPRSSAVLRGESMSRAEAAVRHIGQEWVLACNTKHLDDLLELYIADAIVLRSNCPPVRGAAAIREFFFGALDAGLGEVEVDPIRMEVAGDMAYEAGRCKALVPGAAGKRREERGKYLWVFARQSNGEWKLASDCWSSDLTLSTAELDSTPGTLAKPGVPRKSA
jgi:ketosteroid isomerase-like protein